MIEDIDKFRFEISKAVMEAVRPKEPTDREELVLRLAGVCDAAAMLWCKLQAVDPTKYDRDIFLDLSQAAGSGMTAWATKHLIARNN